MEGSGVSKRTSQSARLQKLGRSIVAKQSFSLQTHEDLCGVLPSGREPPRFSTTGHVPGSPPDSPDSPTLPLGHSPSEPGTPLPMKGESSKWAVVKDNVKRLATGTSDTGRRRKRSKSSPEKRLSDAAYALFGSRPALESKGTSDLDAILQDEMSKVLEKEGSHPDETPTQMRGLSENGAQDSQSSVTQFPTSLRGFIKSKDEHDVPCKSMQKALQKAMANGNQDAFQRGVAVVKYVLKKRFGNLENAFDWFDYNKQGQIGRGQWDTGLSLLQLDCVDLVGVDFASSIFQSLAFEGHISREVWIDFFQQNLVETKDIEAHLEKHLSPAALARFQGLLAWANKVREHAGDPDPDLQNVRDVLEFSEEIRAATAKQLEHEKAICADLKDRNLKGVEALAYIFVAKLGSLEKTWQWFDYPTNGFISRLQWDTGISLLHVDVEAHCGVSPEVFFSLLVPDSQGRASKEEWQALFSKLAGGAAEDLLFGHLPTSLLEESPPSKIRQLLQIGSSLSSLFSEANTQNEFSEANTQNENHIAMSSIADTDDKELEAIAEEIQLEEEIKKLNLDGVKALAYVLVEKLGSLDDAFRWLDTTRKGKFARVQWDTGMMLLNIDFERLIGHKAHVFFGMMDQAGDGDVCKNDWDHFFAVLFGDPSFKDFMENRKGKDASLKKRAVDKCKVLFKVKEREKISNLAVTQKNGPKNCRNDGQIQIDFGDSGYVAQAQSSLGNASDSAVLQARQDGPPENSYQLPNERIIERSVGSDLLCDKPQQSRHGSDSAKGHVADHRTALNPKSERPTGSITDQFGASESNTHVAEATGGITTSNISPSKTSESEADLFRRRIREELSKLAKNKLQYFPVETSKDHRLIIWEVATELGLWFHVDENKASATASGSTMSETQRSLSNIIVGNMKDFVTETHEALHSISKDKCRDFPSSLSSEQRIVVRALAGKLGLWAHSEGVGQNRKVVVYNVGKFADEIRLQLESFKYGEGTTFPSGLTSTRRRVVRAIADDLQLWTHEENNDKEGVLMSVWNLADFAREVRASLLDMPTGQYKEFQCPHGEGQIKIVETITGEFCLTCAPKDRSTHLAMLVGNMSSFLKAVRSELKALAPGDSKDYPHGLNQLEQSVICSVAREMQLPLINLGENDQRHIRVSCPQNDNGTARSTALVEEQNPQSTTDCIALLFSEYATGSWCGLKIFLRFPDLRVFTQALAEIKRKRFNRIMPLLQECFNDTVQLQIDLGTRTDKGLTLEYFQVFLQKAARKAGWQLVAMLFELLQVNS